MFVTWADLGNPEEPGRYPSERFAVFVDVQHKDILEFKEQPEARFKLLRYKTQDGDETWNIGSSVT
jgi:hypothetical protein